MAKAKKLPSGNWRVQLYIGTDSSGKKLYESFTAPTKKEAEYIAAERKMQLESSKADTLGNLIDRYIDSKRNILSPTTIKGYESCRRNNLQSLMGIDASKISNTMLQKAVNEECIKHKTKTVKNATNLVLTVLRENTYNHYNIAFPKEKKQVKILPEPIDVLNAVKGEEIELPCLLAMWLSLRMEEVLGLKKSDIKNGVLTINRVRILEGKNIQVKEVAKTQSSNRSLQVPAYIQKLIDAVPDDQEWLIGLSRKQIYGRFQKCLQKNGIPHMTFHDLRHMNASIMLALGIPDKYAMDRGGWETDYVMKSVYQNIFTSERILVDKKIDDYFENLMKN